MRDSEHTLAKPPDAASRVVFVGDSFVESMFTPLSLPDAVERQAAAAGHPIEAINLGVGATDPRSYYYRTRDVALKLSPDALLLFIYAGNDFVAADDGYSAWPPLVDESPDQARTTRLLDLGAKIVTALLRVSGLPLMRPVRKVALELIAIVKGA